MIIIITIEIYCNGDTNRIYCGFSDGKKKNGLYFVGLVNNIQLSNIELNYANNRKRFEFGIH